MAKLQSALRIGGDGLVLYPTKICSLHSPCVESSLTERSKFVRILGCVFFFPLFLSSSSTCMRINGNVIEVHHRFARRKFSQLVAVNTSETGDTEALDYFPEASSSRARSLCIFIYFLVLCFCLFL